MFVRPAEGRAVRDPSSRVLLAAAGEEKPDTKFWRRRVRDKDVIVVELADETPTPSPNAPAPRGDAPQTLAADEARSEEIKAAPAAAEEH